MPSTRIDKNNTTIRLNSGYEIPRLGFGVYQTPADITADVSRHAIKNGYRHIDSATGYHNEEESVKGMLSAGVPREQLFFTTKVLPKGGVNYETTVQAVDESLRKTGLKYIDLYLLHAPYGGKTNRLGAWKALVEAVEAGKVRSIGVSNYGVHHLEELEEYIKEVDAKEGKGKGGVLSINQVELHPWCQRPDIVNWCQSRGIVMQAFCPLVRAKRMEEPAVKTLAKKHGKKEGQIILRWGLQRDFVILPKSVTHSRIEENADIFDFELSEEDMQSLGSGAHEPVAWDPTTSRD